MDYRRDPRSGGIGQMDEILKKIKHEEGEIAALKTCHLAVALEISHIM